MSTNEKIGNKEQSNFLSQGFQDEISYNGLHDLPMEGYNYTWSKSKGQPNAIEEKLDRTLANLDWFDMFPDSS